MAINFQTIIVLAVLTVLCTATHHDNKHNNGGNKAGGPRKIINEVPIIYETIDYSGYNADITQNQQFAETTGPVYQSTQNTKVGGDMYGDTVGVANSPGEENRIKRQNRFSLRNLIRYLPEPLRSIVNGIRRQMFLFYASNMAQQLSGDEEVI